MQKVRLEPQQTERVPHSIRKLFKAAGPGHCPHCGGPMKHRKAKLSSNGQPYVFLNRYGERLVSPREWFDPAVKEASLKEFTWHCLRHTFASRLTMAGVGLRTVQELMGHKTIQMTVRYAHLAPKHQLAAVQRLCDTGSGQQAPSDTRTDTSASEHGSQRSTTIN